ncbi:MULTISPECIES: hypothetical protein [Serratia]|uniref:hypothetical protein n=1 Tax=Serratia TaxID=613 RepID=UPI000D728E77|nr:hypothetical protein [Serratia marcescens]AWO80694.1 hypothetical protein C1N78_20050 [Serratia marcescens]MBH2575866.1 hypothetical protein [Serratia marcescens]MBH2613119.1 hypothetical protein [Serratia marcescens]MBN5331585.1 hypothetical protein [Serratia marcescens]QDI20320.1 hypothetical protein FBF86_21090 [Serratia marcescens]
MSQVSLADSICRVQQAQAVLSIWLERTSLRTHSNGEEDLIGAIMSLLQGVPEIMEGADEVLAGMVMQGLAGKKS